MIEQESEKDQFVKRVTEALEDPQSWIDFHNQVQKYMSEGATKEQACEWAMQD